MTKDKTDTDQANGPEDLDPEDKPLPRYFIDLEEGSTQHRSLALLIAGKRCYQDQQGDEDVAQGAGDVQPYIKRIRDHCSKMSDYMLPDTPIKEAIFRVILAGGNQPMNAEEIAAVLTEKWAMTAYPRDTSSEVIQRLLDSSGAYCIAQVPEVEEEPSA